MVSSKGTKGVEKHTWSALFSVQRNHVIAASIQANYNGVFLQTLGRPVIIITNYIV